MRILLASFSILSSLTCFGQNGRVGINTSSPSAMLHVKDSGVVFTGAPFGSSPGTGGPAVSGAGSRFMWYPEKWAFRVGLVAGSNWDKDNVGINSIAGGFNTRASGSYSFAMGSFSIADGNASVAFGTSSTALGHGSIAMGSSEAIAQNSVAIGSGNKTTGANSTAIGSNTDARSIASFVIGRYNDSIATSSTSAWVDTDPIFIIGNGSADNSRNNAFVIYKNGNATLDGTATLNGELNRNSTGAANVAPICYGSVSNTGTINSGTGNFTVNKTATGQYEISITGELYSSSGYTASITVNSFSVPRIAVTSASAANLLVVRIWDITGALVDAGFHFIVYKQ